MFSDTRKIGLWQGPPSNEPFILKVWSGPPRLYGWQVCIGRIDASGHTWTYRGAIRAVRRHARLWAELRACRLDAEEFGAAERAKS